MRLQKKSLSRVSFMDLLRRKRTNLKSFLAENGIFSYELLASRCASMGAVPPTQELFNDAMGNPIAPEISSPTEGIVVLEPIRQPEECTEKIQEISQDQQQEIYENKPENQDVRSSEETNQENTKKKKK